MLGVDAAAGVFQIPGSSSGAPRRSGTEGRKADTLHAELHTKPYSQRPSFASTRMPSLRSSQTLILVHVLWVASCRARCRGSGWLHLLGSSSDHRTAFAQGPRKPHACQAAILQSATQARRAQDGGSGSPAYIAALPHTAGVASCRGWCGGSGWLHLVDSSSDTHTVTAQGDQKQASCLSSCTIDPSVTHPSYVRKRPWLARMVGSLAPY